MDPPLAGTISPARGESSGRGGTSGRENGDGRGGALEVHGEAPGQLSVPLHPPPPPPPRPGRPPSPPLQVRDARQPEVRAPECRDDAPDEPQPVGRVEETDIEQGVVHARPRGEPKPPTVRGGIAHHRQGGGLGAAAVPLAPGRAGWPYRPASPRGRRRSRPRPGAPR